MTEPQTPTGKALLATWDAEMPDMGGASLHNVHASTLAAIESEAAQQERERLRAEVKALPRYEFIDADGPVWTVALEEVFALLAEPEETP